MTNPKLLIVSLGILLLSIFETFGNTISGTVLLDNTSDHSGIKIAFEASSETAESTEVYSDINGEFSLNVISGVYKILYTKSGYQAFEITDVFINADASVEEVVLTSKGLKEISGNVSGTWYTDTTYVVINNISLPQNLSLTIEPGTEIRFSDYYSFTVSGSLSAMGTAQDSILFTSGKEIKDRGDWKGIIFNSTNESYLKYTIAEYAGVPKYNDGGIVHITGGNVSIEHSKFRHSPSVGIYSQSGYLNISNSEIYEIFEYGIRNKTNIDVTNNVIHDIEVVGINNYSNSNNIKGNLIYNSGYGIVTFFSSTVSNNIFYNNGLGIQVADENPIITSNTFISNQEGIELYNSGNANPIIKQNIFFNNTKAVDNGNGNIPSTTYNLFNGNTSNFTSNPTGFGSIITTNGNGTDADTYLNIFDDPAFTSTDILNEHFATLSETSPAINAGDPSIFDSNGTVVDLGAKPFFIVPEFSLTTPQDNTTLNVEPTTFQWEASSDLDLVSYSLFIFNNDESEAFENIEQNTVEVDIENNLTPNQSYQWFVIATDGIDSTYSDTLNISIANVPPTSFALTSPVDNATLNVEPTTFQWEASSDLDLVSYSLFIFNNDESEAFENIEQNTVEVDIENNLTPNQSYQWFVIATDGIDSTYSDTLNISIANVPPTSFALTSPVDNATLNVEPTTFQWEASSDLDLVSYSLFIFNNDESEAFENIEPNTVEVDIENNLTPNQSYQWFVIATDGIDSTYSDTLNISIANVPPTSFALTSPVDNATLNVEPTTFQWEASSDLDLVSYSLFIFNNDESEAFENIEPNTVEVDIENNLTPNQSYQWFVIATDGIDSTYSDTLNISIANVPPTSFALTSPVDNATLNVEPTTFQWEASSDLDLVSYSLFIFNNDESEAFENIEPNTVEVDIENNLTPNQSYQWFVIATDGIDSTYSDTLNISIANVPPTSFALTSPVDNATLNVEPTTFQWEASSDLDLVSYSLFIFNNDESEAFENIEPNTVEVDIENNLTPNQSYQWFVIATDGIDSTYSDTLNISIANVPPTSFALTSPVDNATLNVEPTTFQWEASSDLDLVSYSLFIFNNDESEAFENIEPNTVEVDIENNLTPNQSYQWFVIATDGIDSTYSDTLNISIANVPPTSFALTSPVDNATLNVEPTTFQWEASSDLDLVSYSLFIFNNDESEAFENIEPNTVEVDIENNLTPNQSYQWFVIATDGIDSTYSDTLNISIANVPPTSFALTSPVDNATLNVEPTTFQWEASSDLDLVSYSLFIFNNDESEAFENIEPNTVEVDIENNLTPNQSYQWFVIATDGIDSTYSDTLNISIANVPPTSFALTSPVDNATLNVEPTTFQWEASSDLDLVSYSLFIFNNDESEAFENIEPNTVEVDIENNLTPNQSYQWFVIATDGIDSTYSDTLNISIANVPPTSFALTSPVDNATLNVEPTTFQWEASSDLDLVSYSLFIFNNDESEAFENIEQNTVEVDIENNLTPNQSYQWFVIATDGIDSTYSDTLNISIANVLATNAADVQFKIYPNPVKQKLFIQSSSSEKYKVELKNLTGKILLFREMIEYTEFELTEYSKGVYIISIINEDSDRIYTNRIILE